MESIRTVKGLIQKGGMVSQGRVSRRPHTLFTPKVPEVPVAGPDLAIQGPPVRSVPYTFSTLRKPGIRSILYLDNMLIMAGSKETLLIMAGSKEEARRHLATAMELLVALGFIINMKKSTLSPTQELEFLGFLLNSRSMTIVLPTHKLHASKKMARRMTDRGKMTIRELASLIGSLVAAHPAILPAPLHSIRG